MTDPITAPGSALDLVAAVTLLDEWLRTRMRSAWRKLLGANLQPMFVSQVAPSILQDLRVAQTAAASFGAEAMTQELERLHIPPVVLPSLAPAAPSLGGLVDDLPDLGSGGLAPLQATRLDAGTSTRVAAQAASRLEVVPAAFAETASDGRPLLSLISQPVIETYVALGAGMDEPLALLRGMDSMDRILTTQVHDAARQASQVGMATHEVTYYVRIVEPGACGRCIVLAGKKYRWSEGFLRHPKCRCQMKATTEVEDSDIKSPQQIWDDMTEAERHAAFGANNARAITDGADIYRVVNATGRKEGMTSTIAGPDGKPLKVTSEGADGKAPRLVPEGIYKLADGNRDLALDLLRHYGYIRAA